MELSKTIASMAVVLGVVLAAGFAAGEDKAGPEQEQESAARSKQK